MDRKAELLCGRDEDPAARRAIELRHNEACHVGGLAEHFDLRKRVLAGGCIENEQDVLWRLGIEPAEHPPNLGKLLHQMRLVLKPARCVHNEDVDALRSRLLDPVKHDAGGVAAFRA